MTNTVTNLTNINFLTEEQYNNVSVPGTDELWAVETDYGQFSMPSSTYVDLPLGASGSTYIAPANGWISVAKATSSTNQNLRISTSGDTLSFEIVVPTSGSWARAFMPLRKGEEYTVYYSAGGATQYFRFFYAVGSENESGV